MTPYSMWHVTPRCSVCGEATSASMVPVGHGCSLEMCAACAADVESGEVAIDWVDTESDMSDSSLTYIPKGGHWEAVRGGTRTRLGASNARRGSARRDPGPWSEEAAQ